MTERYLRDAGVLLPAQPRVLIQVITGGRPDLGARTVRRHLDAFSEIGDVEWCLREDHAATYERDEYPFNVYTVEFANEYARTHWRHPIAKWEPGGFFGAFPGREWAMRSGRERGYDLVLQLDDNVLDIGPISATHPAYRVGATPLEMVREMVEIAASTNISLLGMQLSSVIAKPRMKVARPGFPYSIFLEKTGRGRLPYFGPFEDDIMHAMDYGLSPSPLQTAGVIESFTYRKESSSKSGMRAHYNPTRGLELAKRYPRNARISVSRRTSSPNDTERGVRHHLKTTGFTPVRVLDRPRFDAAASAISLFSEKALASWRSRNREKMRERAGERK